MSVIHYAVEIITNTSLTNATYGIINGVFRFVTDRPSYDLSTVIPTYGADEIDIAGNSIGLSDVPYAFYEGFFLKDCISSNPNRSIDIVSCGNYSTNSQFSFIIRNDLKFWNYCQANSLTLIGQRVVMWVVIDDVFYQCARGRIKNNPYTETNYQFDVDDDATLIHKNIPPRLSVLPATSATQTVITQGDPIPVVFGNVPYSKVLKNNTDNYILPLNPPYTPAAATNYSISGTPSEYYLTLYSSVVFSANDSRLVGMYLYAAIVSISQVFSTIDRMYKIISNTESSSGLVTIKFDSPLVKSSSGDSSTDILIEPSEFNDVRWNHCLTGTYPNYVSTGDTWWFQISNYAQKSYVSNNQVAVSDISEYNSSVNNYNSVANLLDLTSTPNPTIKLTTNTATKDGKVTQYDRINIPLAGYGLIAWGSDDVVEYIADTSLVTDKQQATGNGFNTLLHPGYYNRILVDVSTQPIQSYFKNQVLKNSYQALYLCLDYKLLSQPGESISLGDVYLQVTDLCNNVITYHGSSGVFSDPIPISVYEEYFDFIPNNLMLDTSGSIFGAKSKSSGQTFRACLKIPDMDPSVFISPQIKNVRILLYIKSFLYDFRILMNEICLVGERQVDTLTADLFARTTGELTGVSATDPNHSTDDVYHAFMHILEDYDGIPPALINYGTLAADRIAWKVSRTLTEQKNSVDYLSELCAQSFVGMFSGRTGKRELRALSFAGTLIPTTGTGKTATHDKSLIVRNSISSYEKTSLDNVYSFFNLQYCYDAGSGSFLRAFNIANVDQVAFPAVGDTDAYGNPLWWSYCSGLQTSTTDPSVGYIDSNALWDTCHASYLLNGVMRGAQVDKSELPWFGDSLLWDSTDTSCTGVTSSAYLYLQLLLQWCTLQKGIIPYSIPLNENTCETELLDIVNFNNTIYTNGADISGWIVGLEVDASKDQLILQVLLQPESLKSIGEMKIIETGGAAKTITETGSASMKIIEGVGGSPVPLLTETNTYADVIRHEDTVADLPSTTRNGQVTFETDGNKRQLRKTLAGASNYWTPDDKFTAAIPAYTYPNKAFATVKDALDYIMARVSAGIQIPEVDNPPAKVTGTAILYWLTGYPGIIHCLFDDGTTNGADYIIFDGTGTA